MLKFKEFKKWLNESGTSVPVSINKETVGYIEANDIETKNKITKIARSSSTKESIINFLLEIGYPSQQAQFLFDILMQGSDMQKISDYFSNRTNKLENFLGSLIDSYSINSNLGIDRKTSLEFFNFSWRTSPSMGPGEVYLSTIFDGGRRPSTKEKGDVIIDGAELEVKGSGARLIGQHGYGDPKLMRNSLNKAMSDLAKSLEIKDFTVIDSGKDDFWNITKKDGRGLEINLMKIAKELKRGLKPEDILIASSHIITAYKTYLINLDEKRYAGTFQKCIGKDGKINIPDFNRALLEVYYNYYYEMEKFMYFCITNPRGMFLIINPTEFMSYFDKGIIKMGDPPSFTNKAGNQGGSFGIKLK